MDNTAKAGTGTTLLTFLLGKVFQLNQHNQDEIIFWMQFVAFAISIFVGILTAFYYIKKLRSK